MVLPLDRPGRWVVDGRGEGRAVRVSAHAEAGFLVVSTWRAGSCVGTVRLLPAEAAELATGLVEGLAQLAQPAVPVVGTVDVPPGRRPGLADPWASVDDRSAAADGSPSSGGPLRDRFAEGRRRLRVLLGR